MILLDNVPSHSSKNVLKTDIRKSSEHGFQNSTYGSRSDLLSEYCLQRIMQKYDHQVKDIPKGTPYLMIESTIVYSIVCIMLNTYKQIFFNFIELK